MNTEIVLWRKDENQLMLCYNEGQIVIEVKRKKVIELKELKVMKERNKAMNERKTQQWKGKNTSSRIPSNTTINAFSRSNQNHS